MLQQAQTQVRRGAQSLGWPRSRARAFLLFIVIPAWLVPGLLDWYFHRRSHIEKPENGGVRESLVHSAMFAEAGMPLVLSVLFEMNPLLVTLMTGAAATHELTAIGDVRLALDSQREVTQAEQHVHSFLEVMPFWVVPLMVLLHEPSTKRWRLTRRGSALRRGDLGWVAVAVLLGGVAPYSEELLRCWRNRST